MLACIRCKGEEERREGRREDRGERVRGEKDEERRDGGSWERRGKGGITATSTIPTNHFANFLHAQ